MKKLLALWSFLLFSLFICCGCQPQEERTYTDAEVQKIFDNLAKLWNGGDIRLLIPSIPKIVYTTMRILWMQKDLEEIKGVCKMGLYRISGFCSNV